MKEAETILSSIEVRTEGKRYPKEIIPIRVLEIGEVNEAFEWASSTVKKQLKKDFTSSAEDIVKLQQMIDSGNFNAKQRDAWYSFGIAFGTILVNEIDGMEWVTVIDGNRELPALRFGETDVMVYPQQLVWDKVKEEIGEFQEEVANMDKEKAEAEFGDVMFSLINAARLYKINPDNALELTNQKFIRRFNYLEEHTIKEGKSLKDMSLEEMDAIWNEAKKKGL